MTRPTLRVEVAEPCLADWDSMSGDEVVLFCGLCRKNVYNLSAMTDVEAAEFLSAQTGEVCIQAYQRADGTVITEPCPTSISQRPTNKLVGLVPESARRRAIKAAAKVLGWGTAFAGTGAIWTVWVAADATGHVPDKSPLRNVPSSARW